MKEINTLIENQYHLQGLYEDIVQRLQEQGIDPKNVTRADISGVDEFHVRGAQVSKELTGEFDFQGLTVLDVGCGLGGPCRMLADEFNCHVTGIDMSHEFIRTAGKLSELVAMNGSTNFVQGDALDLPFKEETFDVVWTQHVQMNIENKRKFYSEIGRVLKDQGTFIYYDIFKTGKGDIHYPVPWANDVSVSFLGTISNMENILKEEGFSKVQTKNQSSSAIEFLHGLFEKIKASGPPKLGLNVLMGASTREKLGNILNGLEDNSIELESGIYKKNADGK